MISRDCSRLLNLARIKNDSASKGMLSKTNILFVEGYMDLIIRIESRTKSES